MADCSLDDYIKQKGIGVNLKTRTAAGIKTNTTEKRLKILPRDGNEAFGKNPVVASASAKLAKRFDARQRLSNTMTKGVGSLSQKTGATSLLSKATAANVRAVPRIGGAPVQSLVLGLESRGSVSDARQKILAKTKFADARQRIINKKLQKDNKAASVPAVFDVRQKLEAQRGNSVQPLFPSSIHPTSGSLVAPQETQQPFPWVAPAIPLGSQQGVLNLGGNIVKTINYPALLATKPPPLMANPVETRFPNPQIIQNNAKLLITMKNDQRASSIVSTQKHFQQSVAAAPESSRFTFRTIADQQPIQTVVSRPPVKVVNKPNAPVPTQTGPPAAAAAAAPKHPEVELASPLQGFRIQVSNLHPNVSHEDIAELFGAVGALKRVRLVKAGHAEVVYVNREDAVAAVAKYHMRELDGLPMNLVLEESKRAQTAATPDLQPHQPLRLNKTMPTQVIELDANILHKALFKTSSDVAPVKPVSFTVHM